jgi:anaerobic magnesium-protoporphyrin IX monomethyl ester cyclase
MKELFLFVRPPRPLWPFNGPASSVWPLLAFVSLAAALRESIQDLQVAILDAPALHMGWRSLAAELHRLRPAYIGIGEEAVSCVEGLRLARLGKELKARVIAGGCFFAHVAEEAIETGLVDVVVHGEGEITIVELVEALRSGIAQDLVRVPGISYAVGDQILRTPPRQLIADLDRLPFPAYDLLPVERYGKGSRNHPDLAAIELGRGCSGSCAFCVLWRQMGSEDNSGLSPRLRTKSPERLIDEIRILTGKYQRRYLGWVDPCFNADPQVPGELAALLIKHRITIGQSAWVRADAVLRDAASGALSRCVRAGLNEVYLGIERCNSSDLHALHKTIHPDDCRRALDLLARDFPEVFTVGSFIYGLSGDTPETVRNWSRLVWEMKLDYCFFIPLTPLPGTPYWDSDMWDPTGVKFRSFNFLPGSLIPGKLCPIERALLLDALFHWNRMRLRMGLHSIFHPNSRKRRLSRRLMIRTGAFGAGVLARTALGKNRSSGMIFPGWYDA